jgi:hypothetical protein
LQFDIFMKMYQLPDGRHAIPIANSKSQCLLENWVEERAVKELDAEKAKKKPNVTNTALLLKDGHDGLLTTASCSYTDDLTTHLDSYRIRPGPGVRLRGSRAEVLEAMLIEKAKKELEEEELERQKQEELRSVTSKDFGIDDFVPQKPAPTATHFYVSEQPVTVWTELRDRVHGVSQTKPTFDSPFRRNTAFTKPIGECWDPETVKPYEPDHVPNM